MSALAELTLLLRAVGGLHPPWHGAASPDEALIERLAILLARSPKGAAPRAEPSPARLSQDLFDATAWLERNARADADLAQASASAGPGHQSRAATPLPPAPPDPVLAAPAAGPFAALASQLELLAEASDLVQAAQDRQALERAAQTDRAEPASTSALAPLESLFSPGRSRAILRELASLSRPGDVPDVAAIVQGLAQGQAWTRLPCQARSSLAHSLHLLLDAGPDMLVFGRDKQQLAQSAAKLLGRERLRVADFIGSPVQGLRAQRQLDWQRWRWPARQSVLLVVSDLGLASPSGSAAGPHWSDWLAQARQRGLRSIVLIPYARDRWPLLADEFDLALSWDQITGVQALRRAQRWAQHG